MKKKMRYFIKRLTGKENQVRIGDKWIEIKPLKAKAALEILLLVLPYVKDVIPTLMATKSITDPKLFRETMRQTMISMAESFPMDVIKFHAIFLGVDEKWLKEQFYPQEMLEAFEVITRVNRLDDFIRLGLSVGMLSLGDLSWLKNVAQ